MEQLLLNIKFSWSAEDLPTAEPITPIFVTPEMVAAAVGKMKDCKARGSSGIVAEMLKASSEVTTPLQSV